MMQERRSKGWWQATVARWRRGGLTAGAFAARERLNVHTLRWWSARVERDTRAEHGSSPVPIEIALPSAPPTSSSTLEIAVGGAVVRCEVGTDVAYLAAVVRALGRS
jgi:hypothetical protein